METKQVGRGCAQIVCTLSPMIIWLPVCSQSQWPPPPLQLPTPFPPLPYSHPTLPCPRIAAHARGLSKFIHGCVGHVQSCCQSSKVCTRMHNKTRSPSWLLTPKGAVPTPSSLHIAARVRGLSSHTRIFFGLVGSNDKSNETCASLRDVMHRPFCCGPLRSDLIPHYCSLPSCMHSRS